MIRLFLKALLTAVIAVWIAPAAFFRANDAQLAKIGELVGSENYQEAMIAIGQMNDGQVLVHRKTDYYYSVCYNRMGLYQMALKHSDRYISGTYDEKGEYEYAIANYGLGNYEQALAYFGNVENHYQGEQEFLRYYGNALYYMEDYQAALERLEQVPYDAAKDEYLNYNLYDCYYQTEEYVRGIRRIQKDLAALNKEDEYYQYDWQELIDYRADFYYQSGRYRDAIADYEALAQEESYYLDEAYYLLARCHAKLGDYELVYHCLELGMEYDCYYYFETYRDDEALRGFFTDGRYAEKIAALEQQYESVYEEEYGYEGDYGYGASDIF